MRVKLLWVIIFLLPVGGQAACESPQFIYLTGPSGVIQTPNFPNKFKTPLCIHWLIDSQQPYTVFNESGDHFSNGKRIRVYLTQLFLKENLTFIDYMKYPYPNGHLLDENERNSVRPNREIVETGYSRIPIPRYEERNLSVMAYATPLRFLGIQLEISTPYAKHFRAKNYFDTYGFNITYSIADEKHHVEHFEGMDSCSLHNCSFGNCYVSSDYRRFFCVCHPGQHGERCEYKEDVCDPRNNVSFCRNGGTCKMHAAGAGKCYCPPEYTGPYCGIKIENSVKECPGPECEAVCEGGFASTHRPCSCHKGRSIPKGAGWMRYEVMLQALDNLDARDFRPGGEKIPDSDWKKKLEIENLLRAKLETVPELQGVDTSVAVVSFGVASTIHFQFFGPNETAINEKVLKEVLTNGSSPIVRLGETFKFNSHPALALTNLFRGESSTYLKVGEAFDLHCEAEGSATFKFKWFKEGVPIDRSLATREINEQVYSFPKFIKKSILMFAASTQEDRGVFTCQVSDMGEEQCLDITVGVIAPPYITVDPMSLTVEKGEEEDQILMCYSENESPKPVFTYSWEKNGRPILNRGHWTNEVIEDLDPYGSLLRITEPQESATYACIVSNYAGSNSTPIDVRVLDTQYLAFCPRILDDYGIEWNRTAVGQVAKRWCPPGFLKTGFAKRSCLKSSTPNGAPKWGPSNFAKCFSRELRELSKQLQILRMGFANKTQIFALTESLINYLARKTFLYNGEGETIIEVLEDIGHYAIQKKDVIEITGDKFLRSFMNATAQLLRFPASCSLQSSVVTLVNLLRKVAIKFPTAENPFSWESELFVLDKLQITPTPFSHPFRFPMSRLDWVSDFLLQIPNSVNGSRVNDGTVLVFIVFRNLTAIASANHKRSPLHSYNIETPIISISTPRYTHSAPLQLSFNVSAKLMEQIQVARKNFTCGGMEGSKGEDRISWTLNACSANDVIRNRTVECTCDNFGHFALLFYDVGLGSAMLTSLDMHWSVILGTVILIAGCGLSMICILIHIEFQFSSDSLYSLKLIVCTTLIFSHLFILSLRSEPYSIGLSTTLCSLLVLSLACQLAKPLTILFSEQINLYPWLRSVSTLTVVFGFFVVFSLPIWTVAIALSHWRAQPYSALGPNVVDLRHRHGSVLREDSSLFFTFAVMVSLIALGFLIFCFKAFYRLRSLRIHVNSDKNQFLDYRLQILSRGVIVTCSTVLMMVTGILHINIPELQIYQYFFGLATLATGIAVFLSYTVKSEHPIPHRLIHFFSANSFSDVPDLEKFLTIRHFEAEGRGVHSRTPEKNYENGPVASILLPQNQRFGECHRERTTTFDSINSTQLSEADTTMETIGGSSILSTSSAGRRDSFVMRTCSVSDNQRPSLISNGTTSITTSMTNPGHSAASSCRPLLHQSQPCTGTCRRARKGRSSSCGGSSCGPIKPDRGRCLLREIEASEYVLPSKAAASHETTSLPAQPSPSLKTDLCPTATGYMDVVSGRTLNPVPDFSRFDPQFLHQHPNHHHGAEALYESIKYESVKDMSKVPRATALANGYFLNGGDHEGVLNLTLAAPSTSNVAGPLTSNGALRANFFKKTDPLPPTPSEFLANRDLQNQTKFNMSEPNVKDTPRGLDYLTGDTRRLANGYHTLPIGAQSLH